MKLYFSPQTRGERPRWLLEEAGAKYDLVMLDMSKAEHKSPDYLKVHPHGLVPALVDEGFAIIESAAICMHIADKYPEANLAPKPGTAERAKYYQWCVYAVATMEPPILKYFMHTQYLPEEQRSKAEIEDATAFFHEVLTYLERELGDHHYLIGDRFTAADVMIGSCLTWASMGTPLLDGHPKAQAYLQRLKSRPALARAIAQIPS